MTKDLFNFNPRTSTTVYLNGFKGIATLCMLLIHSYSSRFGFPFKNGKNLDEFKTGGFYQVLQVFGPVMETFFAVGGVLAARNLNIIFRINSNKIRCFLCFYVTRFTRLIPVTIFILILTLTSSSEDYAPFSFGTRKRNCQEYWYMALTYNFMDVTKIVSTFSSLKQLPVSEQPQCNNFN